MKKQKLELSSVRLTKLNFLQLKRIRGGDGDGDPIDDRLGTEGNP